jgi:hypothetical protein
MSIKTMFLIMVLAITAMLPEVLARIAATN